MRSSYYARYSYPIILGNQNAEVQLLSLRSITPSADISFLLNTLLQIFSYAVGCSNSGRSVIWEIQPLRVHNDVRLDAEGLIALVFASGSSWVFNCLRSLLEPVLISSSEKERPDSCVLSTLSTLMAP